MKRIIGILISLFIVAIPTKIYGEETEDTTKVVISFELTAEDRFIYEVKVSEGGYLVDGSQKITNGIVVYELSVGEKKGFGLESKRGYEIKEIRNNGKELEIEKKRIEIAGVSGKSILEVKYGKIEEAVVPEPDIPDKPDIPDTPNPPDGSQGGEIEETSAIENQGKITLLPVTGDMIRISEYVCLMLIVLYRIYVSSNRRDINTIERVDNIAISGDIEKKQETLKEEKEDER